MQPSYIAEFVMRQLVSNTKRRRPGPLRRGFFTLTRKMLGRSGKRYVRFNLADSEILVPLGHDLPLIRSAFPRYSSNIARLCGYMSKKYTDLHLIDIGANIGDTVAIIRQQSRCPILCIEADEYYFNILSENLRRANLQPVQTVRAFVGTYTGELKGQLAPVAGTAHFESHQEGVLKTIKLSQLMESFPQFRNSKILKIDTDGFDCSILRAELDWLRKTKPMIFFEYDPFFFQNQPYDGNRIFEDLSQAGYTFAILYDNVGDYLTSVDFQRDLDILADVQNYFIARAKREYLDIAAFHHEDREIAEFIRKQEAEFSLRSRQAESRAAL
ncbi:FkbM family methyltransferase [Edaphobacter modestus]|uniref:FkbM family methyltransferase n=1 Tax=Edaphobacter modestus TaxID=388466 RepID=A0A4V2G4L2_9BACT|nr:FkbM family methyltransferase [Edaphobacter modestus]RZU41356.1 FkbM family methyltransferase [Edaphobacter modestus]